MVEVVDSGQELRGQHVAFTGRLASMTRVEAEELVSAHGGEFVSFPNRRTDYLVVGQEGWPLEKDGRPSRKIQKALSLKDEGEAISIVSEEDFLRRLGLEEHP